MTDVDNVVLRPGRSADFADIAGVFARGCVVAYRHIFPPALLAVYTPERQLARWRGHLDDLSPGHFVTVAMVDGEVAGFVEAGPDSANGEGEVHYLFVDPPHMRRRIGAHLLASAERHLADAGHASAILWVFRDNDQARRFYARSGWLPDGHERYEPDLAERGYPITECRYRRRLSDAGW